MVKPSMSGSNSGSAGKEFIELDCGDLVETKLGTKEYAKQIGKMQFEEGANLGTGVGSSALQVKSLTVLNVDASSHEVMCGEVGYYNNIIRAHEAIRKSGVHNYKGCHIPVKTKLNIDYLEKTLVDYHDSQVVEFCKFGWPIGNVSEVTADQIPKNHKSATDFYDEMTEYVKKEMAQGSLIGPFDRNPFSTNMVCSPLCSVEKRSLWKEEL